MVLYKLAIKVCITLCVFFHYWICLIFSKVENETLCELHKIKISNKKKPQ